MCSSPRTLFIFKRRISKHLKIEIGANKLLYCLQKVFAYYRKLGLYGKCYYTFCVRRFKFTTPQNDKKPTLTKVFNHKGLKMEVKATQATSQATSTATDQTNTPKHLPIEGMSRYRALSSYIPVSREKWRCLIRDGRAPQPIRLSSRCVMYRNADVHEWLKDPVNYRVEVAA